MEVPSWSLLPCPGSVWKFERPHGYVCVRRYVCVCTRAHVCVCVCACVPAHSPSNLFSPHPITNGLPLATLSTSRAMHTKNQVLFLEHRPKAEDQAVVKKKLFLTHLVGNCTAPFTERRGLEAETWAPAGHWPLRREPEVASKAMLLKL